MLHATVRNRKINVKSPTTIPRGSQNVDEVLFDLDEEWDGLAVTCVFQNLHTKEVTKKKIVTEVETKVEIKENVGGADEKITSTKTTTVTTETEEAAADNGSDEEETSVTTEVTEVNGEKENSKVITTVTTTVTTLKPVVKTGEETKSKEILLKSNKALVPFECLEDVGQLSVSLTGVDADGAKRMTTVQPDSFWDVVEDGEQVGGEAQAATATLYEQALTAVEKAVEASEYAKATSDKLAQDAANGVFDGRNGKDGKDGNDGKDGKDGRDGVSPKITVGTVTTVPNTAPAKVTMTGTQTDVILNCEIPEGARGDNTPVKGVDYFTTDDINEIVNATLAALPNGDEVAY